MTVALCVSTFPSESAVSLQQLKFEPAGNQSMF